MANTTPLLDPSLYNLDPESLVFFKSETGIHDDDALRKHILDVQAQAYAVAPYPCIRSFNFTNLKISRMPAYKQVLKLGQEREGALLLDIGCCFGNDARKIAADGFPARQIVASDLKPEFWELGHALFRSNPDSFAATFVGGDILDPAFLSPTTGDVEPTTAVDLSAINTLNELRGRFSAIWATSFFHLFSEKDQRQVAHALGSLLSSQSGSVIFGSHVSKPERGILVGEILGKEVTMFCHDPSSWKELWVGASETGSAYEGVGCGLGKLEGPVFSSQSVKLETWLKEMKLGNGEQAWILVWSITRL
ncbi:hypothetical protein HYDPIDRAFT_114355 [Hydnomerulius pinastri MD-312]|uniref:Methyltransferase domain-containing protein n=1 Tax=Hydnomerulius pinastri MD-312 TaxID=994086 RepID=A0A0C9VAN3_9AGAM|nr:hypothetical protein HYDPIDRAFT_114355 [Hydnomerulius pinastri MD-312]